MRRAKTLTRKKSILIVFDFDFWILNIVVNIVYTNGSGESVHIVTA
jgi:hypothetical protein